MGLWHGTNRIVEQRMLKRVWAYAQTHKSIRYSHTHSVDVGEDSDQTKISIPADILTWAFKGGFVHMR